MSHTDTDTVTGPGVPPGRSTFVQGAWRAAAGGARYTVRNPADPADVVGEFAAAGPRDVEQAVSAVHRGHRDWAALGALHRGQILGRAADELRAGADKIALDLTREEGKPLAEARGEVLRAADIFAYFAQEGARADGLHLPSGRTGAYVHTTRRALGAVALITPFNFPAFVPAMKLAPALLAGNGVVWKPAPATPRTGVHIVTALLRAGLPDTAIAYLTGPAAELGSALVAHEDIAAVSFTGSTAVGLAIERAAAQRHARVQLEMGGNNPFVVLDGCDLTRAVDAAADSVFAGTGQKCTAAGRVLVDAAVHDTFVHGLVERARSMTVGNGRQPGVQLGPLISEAARVRVRKLVDAAVRDGAEVRTEWPPERGGSGRHGYFFPPTVVTGVRPEMALFTEEIFGPVAAVTKVTDLDEALMLGNLGGYALSSAVHTASLAAAHRFAEEVPAGLVNVNLPTTGVEYHAPFGGHALSGSAHRELGPHALHFYSAEQTRVIHPG